MNYSYFQFIVLNNIPFMHFFSKNKKEKIEFYSATIPFIEFLSEMERESYSYTPQLVIPPIFIEIMDMQSFQEEMTEFLEKYERKDVYTYWMEKNKNLNTVLKSLLKENKVELLATPVSNSSVPNLSTSTGLKIQVEMSLAILEDHLAYQPTGFWFPNGNFAPGIDLYLKKAGLHFSFLNSKTIYMSDPLPSEEGIAVRSPHELLFYPVEESLYEVINSKNYSRAIWEEELLKLLSHYNHYSNRAIITIPIELNQFMSFKEDWKKSIRYLMDEGYMVNISSTMYEKQFNESIDAVHLSSSSLSFNKNHVITRNSHWYPSLSFLEREIEQWKQWRLEKDKERLVKQLEKEWIMLSALLYQDDELEVLRVHNHLEAANKLSKYMKESVDHDWLLEREQQTPILSSTIFLGKREDRSVKSKRTKKILILSWEYPPNLIGGLGTHVVGLCKSLIKKDFEVHLITAQDIKQEPIDMEEEEGLFVYRVKPIYSQEQNFIHWIGGLNLAMWEKAMEIYQFVSFDLVQAHDWLVSSAAITIKNQLDIPLISTIHATEHGRNGGIYTEMQKFIHEKERQLIQESQSLIVCSDFMKEELQSIFQVEEKKIQVIPNGVEVTGKKKVSIKSVEHLSLDTNKKIIFAMGRMVREKGFGTLLEAAKILHKNRSDLFFMIAGIGPMYEEYQRFIERNHLTESVRLIGYLNEEQKNACYSITDIAVIPSSYEPFGIVALESLLFSIPTIASNTGGLSGIMENHVTGVYMEPNNAESLVESIEYLLENTVKGKEIGEKGSELVRQLFSWNRIGEETSRVFQEVIVQFKVREFLESK